MNKKQGLGPISIVIILAVLVGGAYFLFKRAKPCCIRQVSEAIEMSGIDPFSLAQAPVPNLNGEYNGTSTTTPLADENGIVIRFNNYHFDFEQLSKTEGCSPGAFQDLGVLGYTLMGGVPTAVTLVNERVCGTGYFPHVVLYQATGECRQMFVGCERDTKIAAIAGLGGDRINIHSVSIKPDHISLTFLSSGDEENTSVNLEYIEGALAKK